jgi:hypothetical protein
LTSYARTAPDGLSQTGHDVAPAEAPAETAPVPIQVLARAYAERALQVLVDVMTDRKVTPSTRVNAAIAVLDRAWGKPITPIEDDKEYQSVRLEIIRRIIVDPQHSEGCSDGAGVHPAPGTGPL